MFWEPVRGDSRFQFCILFWLPAPSMGQGELPRPRRAGKAWLGMDYREETAAEHLVSKSLQSQQQLYLQTYTPCHFLNPIMHFISLTTTLVQQGMQASPPAFLSWAHPGLFTRPPWKSPSISFKEGWVHRCFWKWFVTLTDCLTILQEINKIKSNLLKGGAGLLTAWFFLSLKSCSSF